MTEVGELLIRGDSLARTSFGSSNKPLHLPSQSFNRSTFSNDFSLKEVLENSEWKGDRRFAMIPSGYPPWQNMLSISRLQQLSVGTTHSGGENWRALQGTQPVFFQTIPILNTPILNLTSSHKQKEDKNSEIDQPFILLRKPYDKSKPTLLNVDKSLDGHCQFVSAAVKHSDNLQTLMQKPDISLCENLVETTQNSKSNSSKFEVKIKKNNGMQERKESPTRKRSLPWPNDTQSNKKKFVKIPNDNTTHGYKNLEMDVANILVSDIPIAVVGSNVPKDNTIPPKEDSNHEFKLHSSESAADSDSSSSQSEKENCLEKQEKPGTVEFTCQQCAITFELTKDLISHTTNHATNNFTFTCNVCSQVFRNTTGLQKHVEFHTNDDHQYHCSFCFQPCGDKGGLEEHIINVHRSKRPHKCMYCPKAFRDPGSLQKHIRVHTGEKPFQCEACSKSFAEYSSLRKHFRVHTGEQPYKCKLCPKAFSISGNLQRHILTHTGERPYKCSDCSKAFNNPSHLRRHIKNLHSKLEN